MEKKMQMKQISIAGELVLRYVLMQKVVCDQQIVLLITVQDILEEL